MGWANCGEDSRGRPIGYAHRATCDQEGCNNKIDRGLAYACGGMHGDQDFEGLATACENYFCIEHLFMCDDGWSRCSACRDALEQDGERGG